VKEVTRVGARLADGKEEQFDAIILATGYRSNVPSWLKVSISHSDAMKRTPLFVFGLHSLSTVRLPSPSLRHGVTAGLSFVLSLQFP
jgi:hypothetical protein